MTQTSLSKLTLYNANCRLDTVKTSHSQYNIIFDDESLSDIIMITITTLIKDFQCFL